MLNGRSRIRRLTAAALAAVSAWAVLGVSGPATTAARDPMRCGLTTLSGTIVWRDGKLECGPGQGLVTRDDLLAPKAGQRSGSKILSFIALTDFQLPDEESPLRGEFADKCGDLPTDAAFRWNDALLPALLNSEIRAANDIIRQGGPITREPIDFAVQLGDASENQQYNEVRAFIDLLDGATLVDPDSGADGYEGNQSRDPYPSPVRGERLLDLANEPFWAEGLRRADGGPLPWFTVMGNHDAKVRGVIPNDNDAWKTFARAWVTGNLMVNDLAPDAQQRVCEDPTVLIDPAFWTELAASPGSVRLVSPDKNRRLLDRNQWIAEHARTRGVPFGHGPTITNRCTDAQGRPLARACYSVDLKPAIPGSPPVHLIALDTNADEGLDEGNIDQAQWNWLNADLKAHSACFYPSDDATECSERTGAQSSLVVVLSHHTATTTSNEWPRLDGGASYHGADLERLLLRFPNVILHANGHTHANKVWAHERPNGGGYWEVNTSAVADYPHQGRVIELVDNHDGSMSIFAVAFDADAPVDPSTMRWAHDDTPETHAHFGGAKRNINETMLASIARWVGANDPQSGAKTIPEDLSTAADKNVELLMKHPTGGTPRIIVNAPPRPRLPIFPRPRFPFGGFPFPQAPVIVNPPPAQFPAQPPLPNLGGPASFQGTRKGLGRPATTSYQIREAVMLMLAGAGVFWLISSRVRRNQVGL